MKTIPLTKGRFSIVDDEDYDTLIGFKWCYSSKSKNDRGYAVRRNPETGGMIYMHRQIMQSPTGTVTDHINWDTLDNRRINLRVCNMSQNGSNRPKNKNNRSGFKGVYKMTGRNKFAAIIHLNRIGKYLGSFDTAEQAHAAYCRAAEALHREFARTS